jgi:ankyrin repeat protein
MSQLKTVFRAIMDKDTDSITKELKNTPDLMLEVNVDEWGLVHYCAAYGNQDIMRFLICEFNANVNQLTAYRYTPSHLATQRCNYGCLHELMNHRANITLTDRGGQTAVDYLVERSDLKDILVQNDDNTVDIQLKGNHLVLAVNIVLNRIE